MAKSTNVKIIDVKADLKNFLPGRLAGWLGLWEGVRQDHSTKAETVPEIDQKVILFKLNGK